MTTYNLPLYYITTAIGVIEAGLTDEREKILGGLLWLERGERGCCYVTSAHRTVYRVCSSPRMCMAQSGQPTAHGAADGRHDHKIMVQLQNGA